MRKLPDFVKIRSSIRDVETFQCVFETLPPRIVFPDASHAATEFFPLRLDTHTGGNLDGIRRQTRDQKMKVNSSADFPVLLTQRPNALAKGNFVPAAQAADEGKEHGEPHAFRQLHTLKCQSA